MPIWKWFKQEKGKKKSPENKEELQTLSSNLEKTIKDLQDELGNSADIVTRRFVLGKGKPLKAALIYTDGLVNNDQINNFMEVILKQYPSEKIHTSPIKLISEQLINIGGVKILEDKAKVLNEILTGSTAIFLDNCQSVIIASTKGWEARGVEPPENQVVLRGPRDSFTENIRVNTALIRKRVTTAKLRLEERKIGTLSESVVAIMYIEGLAHEKIVQEVRDRLSKIKTDSLLGTGYIEEFIHDAPYSIFPTLSYTERPDSAAGQLLEGKILILLDGTPFVLTVPVTFFMFFQSPDDYYLRSMVSSFLRLLRLVTFFISMTLPALYVAVTTFHIELLPTPLLISLASQREGIPFPAVVEALIMELTFEVLREAGVRMPRSIGQAVSIVGALVLGTAAVEAGIVSSAMVIIVSMTAISNFTAPYIDIANAARLLRFILLFLGATLGVFGILFGLTMLAIHLTSIRSFGIPYLSGIAPFNVTDQKDLFLRFPWPSLKSRPRLFSQQNPIREGSMNLGPPDKKGSKKGGN